MLIVEVVLFTKKVKYSKDCKLPMVAANLSYRAAIRNGAGVKFTARI